MLRPDRASLSDLLCLHSKCQKVTPTLCELLTNGKNKNKNKLQTFLYFMIKIIQAKSRMLPSTAADHQFTSHLGYHYINRLLRNKLQCGFTACQPPCNNCQHTQFYPGVNTEQLTPQWKSGKLLCIQSMDNTGSYSTGPSLQLKPQSSLPQCLYIPTVTHIYGTGRQRFLTFKTIIKMLCEYN